MKVQIEPRPIGRLEQAVEAALTRDGATDIKFLIATVEHVPYSVIVSRDNLAAGRRIPDVRWHISIAGQENVPAWNHLVAIAHEVRPGVCFVIGVPPRSQWMSVHPHCLHLYEVDDANLTNQWRAEGRGHAPS